MKVFRFDCPDDEIKGFVLNWSDLLAAGQYEEALLLLHPSSWDERDSQSWTPEILKKLIQYRGTIVPYDDHLSRVTLVAQSRDQETSGPNPKVDRVHLFGQDKEIYDGMVHYDLPLDGERSDLTARFQLRIVESGIALELLDIHVM